MLEESIEYFVRATRDTIVHGSKIRELFFLFILNVEMHYDYGELREDLGKIFLNDIILNIINNYDIYYFTYNNNTIKNINY